ncbi:cytochrome c oxidase subunit 7A2, mitochondrial [Esox lucius]|uniref:Cytochrome c oxidase subunit 7A2, mitochondrial n=1 Tax=Esox lucius TaxID=8010 RepID=C1BXH5_ESOLU|nr:cytochrome c oxidase subunit 7A2, mitochondrial [Esox lucius]ACO13728.1 Cytochrome c oxidase polypeptide VIIa-liver/heart, mitochondrial precursor [Esox lucius]
MYRQFMCLQQLSRRTICSTARRQVDNMVKEKQKLFQADNGIPVHLKGGAMDAILYRLTMGLTVFGTGFVVYELLSASMPKKS